MLLEEGLWGVPSFRLLGEGSEPHFSTWGQDRIWRVELEIRRRLGLDDLSASATCRRGRSPVPIGASIPRVRLKSGAPVELLSAGTATDGWR